MRVNKVPDIFKNIVEKIPVPIRISDCDGNILYINPKFTETFGYEPGDIPTISVWRKKAYPDARYRKKVDYEWDSDVKKIIKSKSALREYYSISCADGSKKNVEVTFTVVDNIIYAVMNDVTEMISLRMKLSDFKKQIFEATAKLDNKSLALTEVINQVETEKEKIKKDIYNRIRNYFLKAKNSRKSVYSNYSKIAPELIVKKTRELIFARADEDGVNLKTILSQRELKICSLIKKGYSSKEISKMLDISIRTTENHRNNIRKKLSITSNKTSLYNFLQNTLF
jgi:PAS domain S-box-containing protein